MYKAEIDLYRFFLVGDGKVTYSKIRAIIDFLSKQKYQKDMRYVLYNLLNWGVVIQTGENQYELANAQLIKGNKCSIGINLVVDGNLTFDSFPGIKLYKSTDQLPELEYEVLTVNVLKTLRAVPNVRKLMDTMCNEGVEEQRVFSRLKVFEPNSGDWKEVSSSFISQTDLGLFKVYPFTNNFFEYVLKYKGNRYQFKMTEVDRVQFIKMYVFMKSVSINKVWEYDSKTGNFITHSFFPSLIERLLRIHHVITTGTFPHRREYNVDQKLVKQIERIFSI